MTRTSLRSALAALAILTSLALPSASAAADPVAAFGEIEPLSLTPGSRTHPPRLAAAGDGRTTYAAFLEEAGGVTVRRVEDAGTHAAPAVQVTRTPFPITSRPELAASGEHVYVVWTERVPAAGGRTRDEVFLAASHDGADSFSTPVRVSATPDVDDWAPRVAADGLRVFVAWQELPGNGSRARPVMTAGSADGGKTWPCRAYVSGAYAVVAFPQDLDVAVSGDTVYWAWTDHEDVVRVRRSLDSGGTLQPIATVANHGGTPRLRAAGDRVLLTFGDRAQVAASDDRGATFERHILAGEHNRCRGDYCTDPVGLGLAGARVYVAWRGGRTVWLSRSTDGGKTFLPAVALGPVVYTWNAQAMPHVDARGDAVAVTWHTAPDPTERDMDPVSAFSRDGGASFSLHSVDASPQQGVLPAVTAYDAGGAGAGFAWWRLDDSLVSGDADVDFRALSAAAPDFEVLDVTPQQGPAKAERLVAGRPTSLRIRLRSTVPQRITVPVRVTYEFTGEDGPRQVVRDASLTLLRGDQTRYVKTTVVPEAGALRAKVELDPAGQHHDEHRENNVATAELPVGAGAPLRVLFVPVRHAGGPGPGCGRLAGVAAGAAAHINASWPVDPRKTAFEALCEPVEHAAPLDEAGFAALFAQLDRRTLHGGWDKVVGVTRSGWFAAQAHAPLKPALGAAPYASSLDAALVEEEATGGWVVAHELAHQLGWYSGGPGKDHLEAEPAPGYWVDDAVALPADTIDFMHPSASGAPLWDDTARWISTPTWEFLLDRLGQASQPAPTLAIAGTVGADGTVTASAFYELDAEPDPSQGEFTAQALDASGKVIGSAKFAAAREIAGLEAAEATAAGGGFSAVVPRVPGTRTVRILKGDQVLLQRTRTPSVPTVEVTGPSGKVTLGGDMTITWSAADADGDALRHIVSVSTGGDRWTTLATDVAGSSLTVRAGHELAGDAVRVRVTTTDGLNTAEDVSEPFAVAGGVADGKLLVGEFLGGGLYTAQPDGSGRQLILEGGGHHAGYWSPDGKRFVTRSSHDGDGQHLWTYDASGGDPRKVTAGSGSQYPMHWRADGRIQYIEQNFSGGSDKNRTIAADGTDSQPWGNQDPFYAPSPCELSPDGTTMLLYGIQLSDPDGNDVRSVPGAAGGCGTWAPDSRRVVTEDAGEIAVYDVITGARSVAVAAGTHAGRLVGNPDWSPSGEWIYYGVESMGAEYTRSDVWRVHPDGSGRQKVLDGGADEVMYANPHVQPVALADPPPPDGSADPTADAGGPYTADEGAELALAGSGSGACAWDLDGDGEFDDATGCAAKATFADEGLHHVALRVTGEGGRTATDAATVTVVNVAPSVHDAVVAGGALTARISDPGAADVHTAVVDWGDGSGPEVVPVAGWNISVALVKEVPSQ